ncbi:cyclin-A1-like isoform 1-T4 [Synchiropus picturatus]
MSSSASVHSDVQITTGSLSHSADLLCDQQLQVACEVVLGASGEGAARDNVSAKIAFPLKAEAQMLEPSSDPNQNPSSPELYQDESESHNDLSSEYVEDIYRNMRAAEERFGPKAGYMDHLPEILRDFRTIMVDWMTQVTLDIELDTQTLHLAINYLDQIFSKCRSVNLQDLTLIGMTLLFIAAKHQDTNHPKAYMFVTKDGSYTKKELIEMEWRLLKTLDFTLSAHTSYSFLQIFMCICPINETTQTLAVFLADLSLMDMDLLVRHGSSKVAASVLFMANYRVNRADWPEDLEHFSGYSLEDIAECVDDLYKLEMAHSAIQLQATRRKFMKSMSLIECCPPGSACCCTSDYASVFW